MLGFFPKLKRGKLDPAGSTVHISAVEIVQVKVKRGQRKRQNI